MPLPQPLEGGDLPAGSQQHAGPQKHVVAIDCGMKWNIARHLASCGFRVTVVPGSTTSEQVLALRPDGTFPTSPRTVSIT